MTEYTLPYFGQINVTKLEEYYDVYIEFKGNEIQIDLNFENKVIDQTKMEIVKTFIENIDKLDKQNKIHIKNDYQNEDYDTVKFYLGHHLEDFEEEYLSNLIDFKNKTISPEIQLLEKLRLVRIGLYPDQKDSFAIFDYSIEPDFTNYLVVIHTDKDGKLDYMTMES